MEIFISKLIISVAINDPSLIFSNNALYGVFFSVVRSYMPSR